MINLWYNESLYSYIESGKTCGPLKVRENLKKSLNENKINYSINQNIYEKNLLLDYSEREHKIHENLEHQSCFIGPQFCPFTSHGKFLIDNSIYYNKLIVPSQWVKNLLIEKFNADSKKIYVWPAGIELLNLNRNIKYDCLIYFKRRSEKELNTVVQFLESKKLTYTIIGYGDYQQNYFETLLSQCRFCFLLNGTESQGIAVQEIMSSNTPLLVWDVKEWNDRGEEYKVKATSIPYWDSICGEVFHDENEIDAAFLKFYDKIDEYNPQKFIKENLSYKKSIQILLDILNVT